MAAGAATIPNYSEKPLCFVICADGSKSSQIALQASVEHWRIDAHDTLDIIHVEDATKEYLPYDMQRKSVEEYCAVRGKTLFSGRYAFRSYLKAPKVSTKQAVLDALRDVPRSDILIVGYVGRKGPKDDPEVLGSVADISLRESNMSCFIAKRKPSGGPAVYVVGVDGSERANDAANLALRLAKPNERVVLIHIEDLSAQPTIPNENTPSSAERFDADVVEARYVKFLASRPTAGVPSCTFKRIVKTPGKEGGVSDFFLEAAGEEDAEVVLVGVDGLGARAKGEKVYMGSNTDKIVRKATCNVLCVTRKDTVVA